LLGDRTKGEKLCVKEEKKLFQELTDPVRGGTEKERTWLSQKRGSHRTSKQSHWDHPPRADYLRKKRKLAQEIGRLWHWTLKGQEGDKLSKKMTSGYNKIRPLGGERRLSIKREDDWPWFLESGRSSKVEMRGGGQKILPQEEASILPAEKGIGALRIMEKRSHSYRHSPFLGPVSFGITSLFGVRGKI